MALETIVQQQFRRTAEYHSFPPAAQLENDVQEFLHFQDVLILLGRTSTAGQSSQAEHDVAAWRPGRAQGRTGAEILTRGIRSFFMAFLFGTALLALFAPLGFALLYSSLTILFAHLYAYWLRTGDTFVSPRFLLVTIMGTFILTIVSVVSAFEVLL